MSVRTFDFDPGRLGPPLGQPDAVRFANDAGRASATGAAALNGRTELVCGGCGYGAVASAVPLRCPMCAAASWLLAGTRRRTVLDLCLGR
jgi:hypothetical protein